MTASGWSAGLAIVAAIWGSALWVRYRHRRDLRRDHVMDLNCTQCQPPTFLGQVSTEAEMTATFLAHHRIRHQPAPRGMDDA